MLPFLKHLFTPTQNNNNRAKILHHSSLLALIGLVLVLTFTTSFFQKKQPEVLGISYSISEARLLYLTNQFRQEKGLSDLKQDERLDKAASEKAKDMFSKNYWAHFAPDGSTTPWYFIKGQGYEYTYAGENLAKGFTSSDDVVRAWVNSPSHRENLLSDKYHDVGFAVGEGKLTGEETTLVVQMFGSTADEKTTQNTPIKNIATVEKSSQGTVMSEVIKNPKIDIPLTTKSISILILFILFIALLFDIFFIRKKNIQRIVGHNLDHIMLVGGTIILVLFLLSKGVIR